MPLIVTRTLPLRWAALALVLGLLTVACGSGDGERSTATTPDGTTHTLKHDFKPAELPKGADPRQPLFAAATQVITLSDTGVTRNGVITSHLAPIPAIDPAVREAVRAMPVREAYAALSREDPARAAALAPADSARIARSLEVVRSTGQTLAGWQASKTGGIGGDVALHPAILLPERAALYARCDRRFAHMMDAGAIAEVEALLARSLDPALPVMRAIGVPEIAAFLRGECSLDETTLLFDGTTQSIRRESPGECFGAGFDL